MALQQIQSCCHLSLISMRIKHFAMNMWGENIVMKTMSKLEK